MNLRFRSVVVLFSLILGVMGMTASRCAGKGRALIIGVNHYDDPGIESLSYSVPDAKLVADLLGDPARGVFSKDEVRLLTDDAAPEDRKATRLSILEGVDWLSQADPDETVLMYFSGHGVIDNGKQYLACQDIKLTALPFTAVPVDDVNEILDDPARTKARQIVVIFDSCHSGVRRGARSIETESGAVIAGMMTEADGRVTLSSCSADEQSFEDPEIGHGVFTYYLAEALKGAADSNNDGLISAGELHVYVRKKVSEWAQAHGHRQTPRVQSNVSGEIILAKDPSKLAQVEQGKQERRAAWSQLRDRLIQRVGRGKNDLSAQDAPGLLAALDRLIGDRALADDEKISRLAERFCGGELGPDAVVAEMQLLSSEPELAPSGGPGSEGPVVQLFQPEWQVGSSPDDLSVACDAGEDVRIVGLAESSAGVTRVLLDGQVLSAGSLGGKDLKLVSRQAENSLRFDGILHSGDQPSVAVLTAVDALGARKMLRLSLRPRPASGAAGVALRSNTVAVIGLTKREVDQYEELRAVRIGQGLQQQLTRAVRDVAAFTLVEEKAEVVRALSDRQWLEKSAAFDPSMAVQTGKLLGARYVLYGEVYDFASPKENRGKLFIAVALRLVDVETGRYVPGDGQATVDVRKGEHGDDSFDRTTLAEASDKAIHAALQDLMKTNAAHSIPQPVMG